jgi:hypothetical protein
MGIPPDPGRAQLAQVLFLINEFQGSGSLKLTGLAVSDFPLTIPGMPYDLMVCAVPFDDGLSLRIFYDTALFVESTVAAATGEFEKILSFAIANQGARLSDFSMSTYSLDR